VAQFRHIAAEFWVGRCRLTHGRPLVEPACFQRLKLKHDELLPKVALKCNLRHYIWGDPHDPIRRALAGCDVLVVGRCSLTLLWPALTPSLTPLGFNA